MIEVNVRRPRRCEGQHEFASLDELVRWMNGNFRRPKSLAAEIVMGLAELGTYGAITGTCSLDCSYDKPAGYKAKELARDIGFLKKGRGLGSDGGLNLKKVDEYIKMLEEAKPQSA